MRFTAVGLVLALATSASMAGEKETLSELSQIGMTATPEAVVVTISGSKAPDFTSFTMNEPFRVVVDWAGSKLSAVAPEKSFDRGLIRRITTKQFDSEAEKISRVTIELARETSYHVEADGKRVKVHFVPVPDPIQMPEPEPVKEEPKTEPVKVAAVIPEGPLTEPDVAVPAELPPMPQKKQAPVVATTKPAVVPPVAKNEPVVVAKSEPAKTELAAVANNETAMKKTAAPGPVEPAAAKNELPAKSAAAKTELVKNDLVAKNEVAKNELPKNDGAAQVAASPSEPAKNAALAKNEPPAKVETPAIAKNEPKMIAVPTIALPAEKGAKPSLEKPAEQPVLAANKVETAKLAPAPIVQKTEDRRAPPPVENKTERLASFPGVVPQKMIKEETRVKDMAPPTLNNTPASNPQREAPVQTARMASEMPQPTQRSAANVWQPPTVTVKQAATPTKRQLPVVKLASAQGEPLKPSSTLPADPDEPSGSADSKQPAKAAEGSSSGSARADEFDPGPRVMKYIGFQQMADVSRVFVRCDGKAKFREIKADGGFVLELVNTSINVKNNERPLDTTYFNSAVQKVQAVPAGENTRIEIKLRDQVPYKISRIGNTIAIDFSRS